VSQFAIQNDGTLSEIGSPVSAGVNTRSVAVHPSGHFAYASNRGGSVSEYVIRNDGTLSPIGTALVPAGIDPETIFIDLSGRYAYVGSGTPSNEISQFTIGADGRLSPMSAPTALAGGAPATFAAVYTWE
jgi:DNA-binding beta-propeller fold protein YncE